MDEYKRVFDVSTGMPGIPVFVAGYVRIGDEIAENGCLVQAVIGNKVRGKVVTEMLGETNFGFGVPKEGLHRSEIGETVEFYIDGVKCEETFVIEKFGAFARIDLHVSAVDYNDREGAGEDYDPVMWLEQLRSQVNTLNLDLEFIIGKTKIVPKR